VEKARHQWSLAPSRPGLLFNPPHTDHGPLISPRSPPLPERAVCAHLGIGRVAAAAAAARGAFLILVVAHRFSEEGTAVSWAFLVCPSLRPRSATRGRPQMLWRGWMEAREWCSVGGLTNVAPPLSFSTSPPKNARLFRRARGRVCRACFPAHRCPRRWHCGPCRRVVGRVSCALGWSPGALADKALPSHFPPPPPPPTSTTPCRQPPRVTLLESSGRLGGWLHSRRVGGSGSSSGGGGGGFLFELGCRGIRPVGRGREVMALAEALGLQHQTLVSSPQAKTRYLWVGGALRKVPASLKEALTSPLTRRAPLWGLRDLTAPPRTARTPSSAEGVVGGGGDDDDESVAAFATRRFGPEVADVLLDAVLAGVYAGDAYSLSARSTLSSVWAMAEGHPSGSVIRAAIAAYVKEKRGGGGAGAAPASDPLSSSPFVDVCSSASSVSFLDGTQTLADALAAQLRAMPNVNIIMNARATALRVGEGGRVHVEVAPAAPSSSSSSSSSSASPLPLADSVLSALPAPALAAILPTGTQAGASPCAPAASALRGVPFGSVGIVSLAWRHPASPHRPSSGRSPLLAHDGFGYLVPFRERGPIPTATAAAAAQAVGAGESSSPPPAPAPAPHVLGMTWDSTVFPGQAEDFARTRRHWRAEPRPLPHSLAAADADAPSPHLHAPSGYVGPTSADHVPAHTRASETRVTVMMGGSRWPEVADASEDVLVDQALRAVREQAGIAGVEPSAVLASVARSAIPQYTVGHAARAAAARKGLQEAFGGAVNILGNSLWGVGVADTVAGALEGGRAAAVKVGGGRVSRSE
jgi:protoporphyrinogen oxidase